MASGDDQVAELRRRGDEVTNESLDATRRIRQMAEETEEVGGATANKLHAQGEQLKNVEKDMDRINADMRQAEKELNQMEKCCGLCTCPWQRKSSFEKSGQYKKAFVAPTTNQPGPTAKPGKGQSSKSKSKSKVADPIPEDTEPAKMKRITNDAREDEMEENLDAVGGILGNLKGQAQAMNEELQMQNQQLDRLNAKADSNVTRLDADNKRTEDILRKG